VVGTKAAARATGAAAVLALALAVTACEGEDSPDEPDPTTEAAGCVSVGEGEDAVHITVPEGFTEEADPVTVDVLVSGQTDEEGVLPPQVALHHFSSADDDDSDQELLDQALTFAIPFTGATEHRQAASQRIRDEQLTEITFETEAAPGDRLYTVHGQLETVDDDRYAVVLLAPDRASYDELAAAVLHTIATGPC
jgi:hypothetical protein